MSDTVSKQDPVDAFLADNKEKSNLCPNCGAPLHESAWKTGRVRYSDPPQVEVHCQCGLEGHVSPPPLGAEGPADWRGWIVQNPKQRPTEA